jgi:ankyrin repeat protein
MHWACVNNHKEVVDALLEKGADPKIRNERELQPFDEAFMYGFHDICEVLAPLTDMTLDEASEAMSGVTIAEEDEDPIVEAPTEVVEPASEEVINS